MPASSARLTSVAPGTTVIAATGHAVTPPVRHRPSARGRRRFPPLRSPQVCLDLLAEVVEQVLIWLCQQPEAILAQRPHVPVEAAQDGFKPSDLVTDDR